ncbi:MAG: hypothetical protein ACOH2D_11745 [Gelidibacter sp.]
MVIDIQQFNDNELFVNDKQVIKDMNGNWIAKIELTPSEVKAIQWHVRDKSSEILKPNAE